MNNVDTFFKISQRGSSVSTEVLGGVTSFLAMAYVVAVNPAILSSVGIPFSAALTATCIGAALMCVIMGLVANRPVAMASGMGINAMVAYTFCGSYGLDWRVAMSIVVLEGLAILILVLFGLRKAVMDAIPASIRRAIGIGIGLFIAFLGMKSAGLVVANESTILSMGELTSPQCIVALFSLATAAILQLRNVRGGLFISIVAAVILGIPLGVTQLPTSWDFGLDFSSFAAPLQPVEGGRMAFIEALLLPMVIPLAFSLVMCDFFDTMGTVSAIAQQGEFIHENGDIDDIEPILVVDSLAAVVGGFVGCSSITGFLESVAGVSAGARTGLSNIIAAALFILCAFLAPLFGMVSGASTCGALMVVGYLMMSDIGNIEWSKPELALPSFLIIIGIPLTYSITNGIGFGFVSYGLIMIAMGRFKEVTPVMWIVVIAFLLMFIFV